MKAETQAIRVPEKTMRRIRVDCQNAILRARLNLSSDEPAQLWCVDFRQESDRAFGSQLWYFNGHAANEDQRRVPLFGVLEYSLQFGLHELVDGGVFESAGERERFFNVYRKGCIRESLWHPGHRWLAFGMVIVTVAAMFRFLPRLLSE